MPSHRLWLALGFLATLVSGALISLTVDHSLHATSGGHAVEQRTFCYLFAIHDPAMNGRATDALDKLLAQGWTITALAPLGGGNTDAWASLLVLERPLISHPGEGGHPSTVRDLTTDNLRSTHMDPFAVQ